MDPDFNDLPEIETGTPENYAYLKKLFIDFADDYHRRYLDSNNLKENDA